MSDKLKLLFEYQHFEHNQKLDELIGDTEKRYCENEVSLDELEMVAAAKGAEHVDVKGAYGV